MELAVVSSWKTYLTLKVSCMLSPNLSIHPGDQLDHYRLESIVATSGMSTVFRATDLDTGQQVAIKVPHPEMESDPVMFDRFKREQDIGTQMDHPGVMLSLIHI